jgi:hypothetical protein
MKHAKFLSFLSFLIVMSATSSIAETSSDSLAAPPKFRFGFLIGPIASYPVLSINQYDLNRVYDPAEMSFLHFAATSASYEKVNAKLTGGLSIGFSLTYRINLRMNLNISPSVNFIAPKINSTIIAKSQDTIRPVHTITKNPLLCQGYFDVPISLEISPFKSKPNFLTSAGLSLKYETFNSIEIDTRYIREPIIRTNRFYYDFFLSTKFLSQKKQNGIELKFSYSLRDIIYRKDPLVNLPVNSIHLFTSSLLFHIR